MSRPLVLALLALAMFASPAAANWTSDASTNTSLGSNQKFGPAVVADGAGGAFVLWYGSGIRAQRLDARGVPLWGPDGVLVSSSGSDSVVAVPDGAGGVVAAWRDLRFGNPDVFAQRMNGAGTPVWGTGVAVCTQTSDQGDISIVSDDSSGAIIAWQDMRNNGTGGSDVYAQRVLANGVPNWTANGIPLSQSAAVQRHARFVTTGQSGGILYAIFEDNRGASGFDLYVSRMNRQGGFYNTTAGQQVVLGANDQTNFVAVPDGVGGVFLAWEDDRNLGTTGRDIMAQRFTNGLNGPALLWNVNSMTVCNASGTQSAPALLPDGAGGMFVAWQDQRAGAGNDDVYTQRLSSSGIPQWTANGVVVSAAANVQSSPQLVTDDAGGAIVAFLDTRAVAGSRDVFAQRINGSGIAQWTTDGIGLMTFPVDASRLSSATDGRGGIIVGATESRTTIFTDCFVQRADRYGFLGNTEPNLIRVGDVPNDQGGKVKLQFDASYLEFDPLSVVTSYDIFRSVPSAEVLRGARRVTRDPELARMDPGGTLYSANDYAWEFVGAVSALDVSSYSFVASTLGDSVAGSNPFTAFMVQGRGASSRYWTSLPDSGYSVDNLAPPTPAPFTGNYAAGATHLHWDPDTAPDLADYRLYRGSTAGFVPAPANLIASPPDTGFSDAGAAGSFYKLSAVDVHGNESGFALLTPSGTSGVGDPREFALALEAPSPTPSRGEATVRFTLPGSGPVALGVFDLAGRRMATLASGRFAAGAHAAGLADRGLRPGMYLLRLDTPWGERRQRLVVIE